MRAPPPSLEASPNLWNDLRRFLSAPSPELGVLSQRQALATAIDQHASTGEPLPDPGWGNGDTWLHRAIYRGHASIAHALIRAGDDVNACNHADDSILEELHRHRWRTPWLDVVQAALRAGARLRVDPSQDSVWLLSLISEAALTQEPSRLTQMVAVLELSLTQGHREAWSHVRDLPRLAEHRVAVVPSPSPLAVLAVKGKSRPELQRLADHALRWLDHADLERTVAASRPSVASPRL